jgi:hypothetical protein
MVDVVLGAVEIDGGDAVLVAELTIPVGVCGQSAPGPVTNREAGGTGNYELDLGGESPGLTGTGERHPLENTAFMRVTDR